MSETHDFSKRFFADFVAARLRAKQIEKDEIRRASQDQAPAPSPRACGSDPGMPDNSHDSAGSGS